MDKKNKQLMLIIILLIIGIVTLSYISKSKDKNENQDKPIPSIEIDETHITHYKKDDDTIVTITDKETIEDNTKNEEQEIDIKSDIAVIDYIEANVHQDEIDDHEKLYQMLLYAELENGFSFDFENMMINGIPYYNENYENDLKFVDATFTIISDNNDIDRYIVTLTCTDEFTIDDVKLDAYNDSNDNYDKNIKANLHIIDIIDADLHRTSASPTHFIELNNHYYLWAQNDGRIYPSSKNDNEYCVGITDKSILWMSDGASSEELFTEIANNAKWANAIDWELFETEYATLTLEKDDENGLYLMKTARTDIEDEKSNPSYIAYDKDGYGTIYIVIL